MSVRDCVIALRAPRAEDRDLVHAMVEATGVFRPDEVDVALEVFDDAVAAPGVDYHALGAYDDDRLVGFTLYGPTPCTVTTWDLYWIVVDPQVHRLGLGGIAVSLAVGGEDLLQRFPDAKPCRYAPDGIILGRKGDAGQDPTFLSGQISVQDEASQLVVQLLDPQPGERILDSCSAPGTKSPNGSAPPGSPKA